MHALVNFLNDRRISAIALVSTVMIGSYILSYLALVCPLRFGHQRLCTYPLAYRFAPRALVNTFYWPLAEIDKRIRPADWCVTPGE